MMDLWNIINDDDDDDDICDGRLPSNPFILTPALHL